MRVRMRMRMRTRLRKRMKTRIMTMMRAIVIPKQRTNRVKKEVPMAMEDAPGVVEVLEAEVLPDLMTEEGPRVVAEVAELAVKEVLVDPEPEGPLQNAAKLEAMYFLVFLDFLYM